MDTVCKEMDPSFDIDPIVLKYVRGEELSADESARLRQWMSEAEGREAQINRLRDDPGYVKSQLSRVLDIDTQAIWSKFEHRLKPQMSPVAGRGARPHAWRPWHIAAASVMLLLGAGGAWLWSSYHRQPATMRAAAAPLPAPDIRPGSNRAVLTLTDGRRIDLGTAANGAVTEQGNSKVSKLPTGQLVYSRNKNNPTTPLFPGYNCLTTPRAGQFTVTLPDGTRVWLNNASTLRYPVAFTGGDRTVEVAGEAYFEVAKDPAHPFRVLVHKGAAAAGLASLPNYSPPVSGAAGSIEVLGTSFNVMAYSDEPAQRTTLVAGAVRVHIDGQDAVLRPAEQTAVDAHGKLRVIAGVNVDDAIAWKNGFFHFEHAGLETTMRQLARWYDIQVVYEGHLPAAQFNGRIERDLPLSDILKGLENEQVHFKLEGRRLTVMP